MTIQVIQEQDGSLTISWDENDPVESILNTWTEQDFVDAIMKKCESLESEGTHYLKDTFTLGDK